MSGGEWDADAHGRDEAGKFSSTGAWAGKTKEKASPGKVIAKATAEHESLKKLDPDERKLLKIMSGKKMSDRKTVAAMGMDHETVLRMTHAINRKLEVNTMTTSLRDVGRSLGLHKEK